MEFIALRRILNARFKDHLLRQDFVVLVDKVRITSKPAELLVTYSLTILNEAGLRPPQRGGDIYEKTKRSTRVGKK